MTAGRRQEMTVFFKSVTNRTTTKASSRFVQKENSLTCRSVNLNYEMNGGWIEKKLGLEYLSVGVYAEDVFKVSTIKQERGVAYPFARKYSLSLTARFKPVKEKRYEKDISIYDVSRIPVLPGCN